MVYSLQEINGITAALAEELFHKGKDLARIELTKVNIRML